MYKKAFKPFLNSVDYYDNCMYNHEDAGQVAEFELQNMTTKPAMMYEKILEYSELQLSVERDCLCITTPWNLKTTAE